MRKVQYQLARYLKRNGITIAFVAKCAGIQYELLRKSMNGTRVLTADELVAIIVNTEITLDDILAEE